MFIPDQSVTHATLSSACNLQTEQKHANALSLFGSVGKAENESLRKPYGRRQVDLRAVLQEQNSDA